MGNVTNQRGMKCADVRGIGFGFFGLGALPVGVLLAARLTPFDRAIKRGRDAKMSAFRARKEDTPKRIQSAPAVSVSEPCELAVEVGLRDNGDIREREGTGSITQRLSHTVGNRSASLPLLPTLVRHSVSNRRGPCIRSNDSRTAPRRSARVGVCQHTSRMQ